MANKISSATKVDSVPAPSLSQTFEPKSINGARLSILFPA